MHKRRLLVACLLLCTIFTMNAQETKDLSFRFFDFPELGELGQKWGDATLIVFPNGEVMLIDAGISRTSEYLVSNIKGMGITHIDRIVLSHLHSDHYGGLSRILDNFSVGEFYWNGFSSLTEKWVIDLFVDHNVPVHLIAAGDRLDVGDVTVEVLYPSREQLEALPIQNPEAAMIHMNNNALCIRFEYGKNSALFSGDLYRIAEDAVIDAVPSGKLDCDLLKINHHGHDTSSGKAWVRATSPEVAVMMGNIVMNLVLYKRFVDVGCTPLATWMNGNIVVHMDGTNINVQAEKPEIHENYKKLLSLKQQ